MPGEPSRRVLVVDDDAEVRKMLSTLFSGIGLTVDSAEDGHEALSMLGANRYAVIVLDLIMPGFDGFSVLNALGTAPAKDSAVVIVLTGADPEVCSALDARVVHGIVRKPFDSTELASLVRSCVELRTRGVLETMAIAAFIAGSPLIALLPRI
jgi:CheY-like chemotaxis protein